MIASPPATDAAASSDTTETIQVPPPRPAAEPTTNTPVSPASSLEKKPTTGATNERPDPISPAPADLTPSSPAPAGPAPAGLRLVEDSAGPGQSDSAPSDPSAASADPLAPSSTSAESQPAGPVSTDASPTAAPNEARPSDGKPRGLPSPTGAVGGDPDPAAELLLSSEKKKLALADEPVLVVDGRPRYHLEGCASLDGSDAQELPAAQAIELGFTPCSRCAAATRLLVALRR